MQYLDFYISQTKLLNIFNILLAVFENFPSLVILLIYRLLAKIEQIFERFFL